MSEEKGQQLLYQMQMLETYLADLINKENSLMSILKEAASAIESIKSIKGKSELDTLVPIGMGSFVKAKISSNEKLIVNLGAEAALEKDSDSAINFLESRIKELEVALQNTAAQKQEVVASLEHGKQELNRIIQTSPNKKQ